MPSIHLTRDEDRPLSTPTSTSSGMNWMKLETLEELPEPLSRGSSFEASPSNNIFSLVSDTMLNVRDRLAQRKTSDTNISQGGTLVDEDEGVAVLNSSLDDNKLNAVLSYRRSYSDKSVSSVATVIEKNVSDSVSSFKPIYDNKDETPSDKQEASFENIRRSLSAANRRSLFSNSKQVHSKKTADSDNVFESAESKGASTDRINLSRESESALSMKGAATLDEIRRVSPNNSFRDFIKQLAAESVDESIPQSHVSKSDATSKSGATKSLDAEHSTLAEVSNKNVTDEYSTNNATESLDSAKECKDPITKDEIVVIPVAPKKSYFSTAFNSLSNILNKYSDSKQSKCTENINDISDDDEERLEEPLPQSKPTSTFMRLFSHQALAVHSNSAFNTVASGLSSGKIELDHDNEHDIEAKEIDNQTMNSNDNDITHRLNTFDKLSKVTKSTENSVDSLDDINCRCASSNASSSIKGTSTKYNIAANNAKSFGIHADDRHQQIKCPLGKNCSLRHENGRHVMPNVNKPCPVCSDHKRNSIKSDSSSFKLSVNRNESAMSRSTPQSHVSTVSMSHDHFDYIVQQIFSMKTQMKDESLAREHSLKEYFTDQMEQVSSFSLYYRVIVPCRKILIHFHDVVFKWL